MTGPSARQHKYNYRFPSMPFHSLVTSQDHPENPYTKYVAMWLATKIGCQLNQMISHPRYVSESMQLTQRTQLATAW